MKKIKITEKQSKFLENLRQIDDNRSEIFEFNSVINYANIDFDTSKFNYEVSNESVINFDWSLLFQSNENGFSFNGRPNYFFGVLKLYNSDNNDLKDIEINKSWKIVGENFIDSNSFSVENMTVFFDFVNKTIKI